MRFDFEEEVPVRDPKTGLCISCEIGEVGELLGLIDPGDPLREFKGYTSKEATEKKVNATCFFLAGLTHVLFLFIITDIEECFQERGHVL